MIIDRPPAFLDTADARAGVSENLDAFTRTLQLLGCFNSMSDDFSAQSVSRPREGGSMTAQSVLREELTSLIAREVDGVEPGHCIRVDNLASDGVEVLVADLPARVPDAEVHVLATRPAGPYDIAVDRAVELRNRKVRPLVLLVPAQEGRAASSLDNSFHRIAVLELLSAAAERLEQRLDAPDVVEATRSLKALLRRRRRPCRRVGHLPERRH